MKEEKCYTNQNDSQSKIWPGYIPPKKNELLSSWLVRVSREHRMKVFSFTKFYFKSSAIWNRDIDKWLPDEHLKLLKKFTPLSYSQLRRLLLSSFQNIIFEGPLGLSYTVGISNIGIYHRNRKLNGLLICPSCLNIDSYFKKEWRLLSSLICTDCQTHLTDHCPKCKSPIVFHRLDMGDKSFFQQHPLYECYNCHYDLRKNINHCKKSSLIYKYQDYINKTIKNGYNDKASYSFTYFKIMFLILNNVLTTSKQWNRIKNGFISEYKIQKSNLPKKKSNFYSFKNRKIILPLIYELLEDWPKKFIDFNNKYNIRYSDYSKNSNSPLPYWFHKVFI